MLQEGVWGYSTPQLGRRGHGQILGLAESGATYCLEGDTGSHGGFGEDHCHGASRQGLKAFITILEALFDLH